MSKMRVALVTGGSRGIGLEVARRIARNGHHVVLVARDVETLESENTKITSMGGTSEIFSVDFLQKNSVQALQNFLEKRHLSPTILINALGGGFGSSHFDKLQKFEEVMRLNFFVAHELTKLVLENAKIEGWGRFIYFGTLAVNQKSASAPYIASKSALIEYMKTINKEMCKISPNIMAAAVSPGAISVPGKYLSKIEEAEPHKLVQFLSDNNIPVGRLGTTEEVAEVVSFLCQERNNYLHGCNIQIDGGASN